MEEGSTTGVADEPARVPGYGPVEAKGVVAYIWQLEGIWGERVVRYDLKTC